MDVIVQYINADTRRIRKEIEEVVGWLKSCSDLF